MAKKATSVTADAVVTSVSPALTPEEANVARFKVLCDALDAKCGSMNRKVSGEGTQNFKVNYTLATPNFKIWISALPERGVIQTLRVYPKAYGAAPVLDEAIGKPDLSGTETDFRYKLRKLGEAKTARQVEAVFGYSSMDFGFGLEPAPEAAPAPAKADDFVPTPVTFAEVEAIF